MKRNYPKTENFTVKSNRLGDSFDNNKSAMEGDSSITIGSLCGTVCFLLCFIDPVSEITKYSVFYISGLCSVFFITICIIYKGHIRIPNLWNGLPILFLFLMMFVSSLWAPSPRESLWRAGIHLIFLWIFLAAFIAASNKNIRWFYYIVIFVPYLVLITSLFIYYRYGTIRPENNEISDAVGSFSNIAPAIVIPLIPFHIYLHLIKWNKLLNYLSLYSAIIVVLISQSRGGYLMLAIILLVSPFLFNSNYRGKLIFLHKMLIICIIIIGSVIFFFGYESTIGRVAERFSSSQLLHFLSAETPVKGEGDYRRFIQYATGISVIKSHPIMGVGFYGFSTEMGKMLVDTEGSVSHNIFFTVWGEMGIFGLSAFFWLTYSALTKTLRVRSHSTILRNHSSFLFYSALVLAILLSLLHAQFRPQLTNPSFYIIFALALSVYSPKRSIIIGSSAESVGKLGMGRSPRDDTRQNPECLLCK